MEKTFDGKWVFVVNANFTSNTKFLGGTPIVVADNVFEGHEDGFYAEFRASKYAPRAYKDYT